MAKLAFMKTSNAQVRVRRYDNSAEDNTGNFTEEYHFTTAQWKALLDVVGVAASVAAGTADTEASSQSAIPAGKLSPVNFD
jgi:hypothetical protein